MHCYFLTHNKTIQNEKWEESEWASYLFESSERGEDRANNFMIASSKSRCIVFRNNFHGVWIGKLYYENVADSLRVWIKVGQVERHSLNIFTHYTANNGL